jgi:hypothetical protein
MQPLKAQIGSRVQAGSRVGPRVSRIENAYFMWSGPRVQAVSKKYRVCARKREGRKIYRERLSDLPWTLGLTHIFIGSSILDPLLDPSDGAWTQPGQERL